jgi:starvation-inducible outer membrane lipoprotein
MHLFADAWLFLSTYKKLLHQQVSGLPPQQLQQQNQQQQQQLRQQQAQQQAQQQQQVRTRGSSR